MNPSRLSLKITIKGADDDATMVWLFLVELDEVSSVESQYGATSFNGKSQDRRIRPSLIAVAGFENRENIVPQSA